MIKLKNFLLYSLSFIVLLISSFIIYCKMGYSAQNEYIDNFISSNQYDKKVTKTKLNNDIFVYSGEKIKAAMIFYPGAKIEFTAYEPLMYACASKGIMSVLIRMPLNFAFLNYNAAKGIKEKYPHIKNWYIGGHSLGGVVAGMYLSKRTDEFKGLILFASYIINDISKSNLKVLSIYGSEDKVLTMSLYNKYKKKLTKNFKEVIIKGGCHSYFGMYGLQKKDGTPTISNIEQIEFTASKIAEFVDEE